MSSAAAAAGLLRQRNAPPTHGLPHLSRRACAHAKESCWRTCSGRTHCGGHVPACVRARRLRPPTANPLPPPFRGCSAAIGPRFFYDTRLKLFLSIPGAAPTFSLRFLYVTTLLPLCTAWLYALLSACAYAPPWVCGGCLVRCECLVLGTSRWPLPFHVLSRAAGLLTSLCSVPGARPRRVVLHYSRRGSFPHVLPCSSSCPCRCMHTLESRQRAARVSPLRRTPSACRLPARIGRFAGLRLLQSISPGNGPGIMMHRTAVTTAAAGVKRASTHGCMYVTGPADKFPADEAATTCFFPTRLMAPEATAAHSLVLQSSLQSHGYYVLFLLLRAPSLLSSCPPDASFHSSTRAAA